MPDLFSSVFANETTVLMVFIMALVALVVGALSTYIYSFKIRSTVGFFVTSCLIPVIVSLGICLIGVFLTNAESTATARIVTIAIALGLVRFRSAQGKAEEMLALLSEVVIGLIIGLGYLLFGGIFGIAIPLLFVLFFSLPIFKNKRFSRDRLLKITIPESLDYSDVFEQTFAHYLKDYELVEVKTTGMGSMSRLSYRVIMKNPKEEKEMIDELRIKNGNLEISVLPYVDPQRQL